MKTILKGAVFALFFVNAVCYGQLSNYFKENYYKKYRILDKNKDYLTVVAEKKYTASGRYFDVLKVYMNPEKKTEVYESTLPMYRSERGTFAGSLNMNGRYFIAVKYAFSSVESEVVLYEFDYKGKVKSQEVIFRGERSNDISVVGLRGAVDGKSIVTYRRFNNQVYYSTFDLDSNKVSKESRVYVPYLTSSYNFVNIDGNQFYIIHYVGDEILVHTIKDTWLVKTEKVEADIFESCNYNYVIDGSTLYLVSGMQYLNFKYMTGVSAHRFTPDQKVVSTFHEFTKEDYDLSQLQRKSYTYFDHYDTDVQRSLVQTKENLVLSWGFRTGTVEEQVVSLWFDKNDMSLKKQQMLPRKVDDKKYYSHVSTYVLNDEVRGFYYDYPTNLSIKDYSKRKKVKAIKSASLIDYSQSKDGYKTKDIGKQKILPDEGEVYQYDDYVAILCHKGKKAYWKIVNK